MSFEAMAWAVKQKLPVKQKIVLLMLADRTNKDTGRCDPSIARLADDCGMSETSVKDAIRSLREAGLVVAHSRTIGAVSLPNHYELVMGEIQGVGRNAPPNQEDKPVREPDDEETVVSSSPHRALTVQPETTAVALSQPSQSKKGTRLPENWVLPRAWGEWALAEGWAAPVIRAEAEKFRDHWISTTGRNAAKLDWQATWRNWMRNSKAPRGQQGGQHGRQDALANWVDAFVNGAD